MTALDRQLLVKIFTAADAAFDPCGAVAFAERLGRDLDAGRVVFPTPLEVGGIACARVELDRCPEPGRTVRTVARALAGISASRIRIHLRGCADQEVLDAVERAVTLELAGRPGVVAQVIGVPLADGTGVPVGRDAVPGQSRLWTHSTR